LEKKICYLFLLLGLKPLLSDVSSPNNVKPYIAEFQQRHEADVAGETPRLVLMLSPVLALTSTPSVLIVHEITAAQLRCVLQSSTSSLTVEVTLSFPSSL